MSTKEQILNIIKESGATYISGEEMANRLFVTRAAVWKGIKALEKEGLLVVEMDEQHTMLLKIE